ncbi:hypothetical protein RA280_15255 [Cupriavidus sp. CV2]|uniref:hypothetical protein n=1 Tax=Cupriavidus ulmosensis TaxID=3065913 RepID=UPI00296AFA80|nr:hypothetical protein [Cupriavidus sp. CV2]MDW3683082.1 hypothetical protein [Cupriavidus sp. CV2]
MIRRLLMAYSASRPVKIICEEGRPYLERYFVCAVFGIRIYLHRFVGSDPDRGLHDHPWRWAVSLILLGWYYEATRQYGGLRPVRWFNFLTGDTFHRVILNPATEQTDEFDVCTPAEVWTLFIVPAKDVKAWGFLRDKGQIGQVFTPFSYGQHGKPAKWWLSAPKGSEVRQ